MNPTDHLNFNKTVTIDENFKHSGKIDACKHILNKCDSIKESAGAEFFKIITEISSGPDALPISS